MPYQFSKQTYPGLCVQWMPKHRVEAKIILFFYIDNEINDEKITGIDIIILGSYNWHSK